MRARSSSIDSPWTSRIAIGGAFVALILFSRFPALALGCPGAGVVELEPGAPVFDLTAEASCPNGPLFSFEVPNDASKLVLEMGNGVGNANLLIKKGSIPTRLDFDYFSGGPGNAERIEINLPEEGTWYVALDPRSNFAGARLVANLGVVERPVRDRVPAPGIEVDRANRVRFFSIDVPPGTARLDVDTSGGTGNADLYLRFVSPPNTRAFDAKSVTSTNAESVHILDPQGGNWKIAVVGAAPYSGVTLVATVTPGGTCVAGDTNLCLFSQRFKVEVDWKNQHANDQTGVGHALAGTDETGYFWFFSSTNTELVVKLLDGRAVNGQFWVFYGGLSDVEFEIRVTDTVTGAIKSYLKPAGSLTGGADTSAFTP